jgi:tetratricopeptide (TPR) repeat protein
MIVLFFISINSYSKEFVNLTYNEIFFLQIEEQTDSSEAARLYKDAIAGIRDDNFGMAEEYLLRAIELDSNFFDALCLLGIVYTFQNKIEEAENIENKFIELIDNNIDNRNLYYYLASIYENQKRFVKEITLFKKLFEIESKNNNVFVYHNIGILYHELREYNKSNYYLIIAYNYYANNGFYPGPYEISALIGVNYYYLGNYHEAIKYLEYGLMAPTVDYKDPRIKLLIELIKEKIK